MSAKLGTGVLLLLLLVATQGCIVVRFDFIPQTASEAEVVDMALVERGIVVYQNNYCGVCHALPTAETNGMLGPAHDNMGALAEERIAQPDYTGTATTAAEYLRESLLDPAAYLVPGYAGSQHVMPAFTHLPPEDIEAMVYMLLQQRQ
jgi:cytochrome c551/c552